MTPAIDADKWYWRFWSWTPDQIIRHKNNNLALARMWDYAKRRSVFGYYRYELSRFGRPTKPDGKCWNFPQKMREKLEEYEATRNKEALVDVLNYLVWEWERPSCNGVRFFAADQGIKE